MQYSVQVWGKGQRGFGFLLPDQLKGLACLVPLSARHFEDVPS
jgi:hypothetical protein